MELKGKVALVTGATGGIGSATAKMLAGYGAEVIATGRDVQRGEQLVKEIGGSARFVESDLSDMSSLRRLVDVAGEVDVLVNNAGVFPSGPTTEQSVETFEHVVATNLRVPYFLTAALVPAMVAKGNGSIINVTSMAAHVGLAGLSICSATKSALEALTRSWAAEFGAQGVRVNSISPGPIRTQGVMDTFGKDNFERDGELTLLRRVDLSEEVGEAVCFLASDRASYMTGATPAVDGGRMVI